MVGALSGTWLVSGVIPTMVFYGLKILDPSFFLLASLLICAIISLATGSSWGTSATVGIALIGIGESLGISSGMTAGAVLSGAYFGDKMSPMSDTTNLAPAMAGSDLFSHIRYMTITTIPTFILTLIIFTIVGFNLNVDGNPNLTDKLDAIENAFNVTPLLMFVPGVVIFLIYRKTPALVALFIGVIVAGVASIFFQPNIIVEISNSNILNFNSAYKGVMQSITVDTSIETSSSELNDLLSSGGMKGMLGTCLVDYMCNGIWRCYGIYRCTYNN
jgi:NhaC family Na+:H+ antiporter